MIQEQLGAVPPPAPAPAPVPSPGLRLAAHTPSAPPAAAAPPPRPQPAMNRPAPRPPAGESAMEKVKKVLSITVTVVLVLFGIFALYAKWSRRVRGVSNLIHAASSSEQSDVPAEKIRWTLPDDDGAVLLVKSANHTNVAAALATVYTQITKRPMQVVSGAGLDEVDTDAPFAVLPALKGAVHIEAPMEWKEAQATNVAAGLSQQLHTLVVLAIMGDDAETGMVSIYEDGERRFRVRHWIQIKSFSEDGIKEFTEREGEVWAMTHGYVPGPTNFLSADSLAFQDVNQLVLNLGIDVSETPEEVKDVLVLKATGPPGTARPAPARK